MRVDDVVTGIDVPRKECKRILRSLEVKAYSYVVDALRAQGKLTENKQEVLKCLAEFLKIPEGLRRAEFRRAANDNVLGVIAQNVAKRDSLKEWVLASSRTIPIKPRVATQTMFTPLADTISDMLEKMNLTLPDPSPQITRDHGSPERTQEDELYSTLPECLKCYLCFHSDELRSKVKEIKLKNINNSRQWFTKIREANAARSTEDALNKDPIKRLHRRRLSRKLTGAWSDDSDTTTSSESDTEEKSVDEEPRIIQINRKRIPTMGSIPRLLTKAIIDLSSESDSSDEEDLILTRARSKLLTSQQRLKDITCSNNSSNVSANKTLKCKSRDLNDSSNSSNLSPKRTQKNESSDHSSDSSFTSEDEASCSNKHEANKKLKKFESEKTKTDDEKLKMKVQSQSDKNCDFNNEIKRTNEILTVEEESEKCGFSCDDEIAFSDLYVAKSKNSGNCVICNDKVEVEMKHTQQNYNSSNDEKKGDNLSTMKIKEKGDKRDSVIGDKMNLSENLYVAKPRNSEKYCIGCNEKRKVEKIRNQQNHDSGSDERNKEEKLISGKSRKIENKMYHSSEISIEGKKSIKLRKVRSIEKNSNSNNEECIDEKINLAKSEDMKNSETSYIDEKVHKLFNPVQKFENVINVDEYEERSEEMEIEKSNNLNKNEKSKNIEIFNEKLIINSSSKGNRKRGRPRNIIKIQEISKSNSIKEKNISDKLNSVKIGIRSEANSNSIKSYSKRGRPRKIVKFDNPDEPKAVKKVRRKRRKKLLLKRRKSKKLENQNEIESCKVEIKRLAHSLQKKLASVMGEPEPLFGSPSKILSPTECEMSPYKKVLVSPAHTFNLIPKRRRIRFISATSPSVLENESFDIKQVKMFDKINEELYDEFRKKRETRSSNCDDLPRHKHHSSSSGVGNGDSYYDEGFSPVNDMSRQKPLILRRSRVRHLPSSFCLRSPVTGFESISGSESIDTDLPKSTCTMDSSNIATASTSEKIYSDCIYHYIDTLELQATETVGESESDFNGFPVIPLENSINFDEHKKLNHQNDVDAARKEIFDFQTNVPLHSNLRQSSRLSSDFLLESDVDSAMSRSGDGVYCAEVRDHSYYSPISRINKSGKLKRTVASKACRNLSSLLSDISTSLDQRSRGINVPIEISSSPEANVMVENTSNQHLVHENAVHNGTIVSKYTGCFLPQGKQTVQHFETSHVGKDITSDVIEIDDDN